MLQLTAIGRLTKDPEFKVSRQSNAQFLVFDLAVNKGYGNNQTTVFINCCASDGVKNALSKAKKGSHVAVTGELSTELYQKNDGSTGENIKCFVTSFSFINSCITSSEEVRFRAPVGSSANIILGSTTKALAIPTRCC